MINTHNDRVSELAQRVSTRAAVAAMLGAAALWGMTGGVVAGLHATGAAAASTVELLTGLVLCGLTIASGQRLRATVRTLGPRLGLLGLLEAVNVVCYYVALQLAPVGPVMALHLGAPILLTAHALVTGRRRLNQRAVLVLALTAAALVLIATGGVDGGRYPHAEWGFALSGFSAVCLAFFVSAVGAVAGEVPPMAAAGAQMLLSGLLLSPALLGLRAHPGDALSLLALSLVLFAPACWLYWTAMRRLAPITASTILLAEPFFGTLLAAAVYGLVPTLPQAVAAGLVVVAVYLSIQRS
jgi:drug/metabolite transporter (DMT)-like permease